MDQPRRVGAAEGLQRLQHGGVELALAHGRDALLDRAPDEVVAERERVGAQGQQARVDALVDRRPGAA